MIPVTKTYLPSLDQYVSQLERIWQAGWITNNGQLTKELAEALRAYLGVPNLELITNGTLALQLAIKTLGLKGEIITTPFSYVATTTVILWENCEPVFVDIEDKTFCIDTKKIEAAITERTSAILATHVYGYPCDVKKIEQIATEHQLKVIYDAAHAFGVKLNGQSILCHGDISALSFHATKLFHTTEGGALICQNEDIAKQIALIKGFGHIGEDYYREMGINGKMSELHAAMGLCVLPKVDEIVAYRRALSERYDSLLNSQGLILPLVTEGLEYNYAYYPVLFPSHEVMMHVRQAMIRNNILPRRYFYPSLNTLPYLRPEWQRTCPISESIASRVLCLPLYFGLEQQELDGICGIVTDAMQ
ncbi:dTDP-4-amino-4,6-dideoxygalactose transaminase [Nitrosospira sp. Nsp18]|uniref:DegT/DnrJ/EryC1/StrS family aminotransferase n=1 Tax=Nitrosospira sp. Nsp18 TaxID=1855334 RepID=UPI000890DAF9|nr:DegT/DnrJ/EryC1/StrS family aminotransferase [Nitrosospira sp. Nsp18]SDA21871.1 dTDP-4-amino-4,6-dideoxygalactose transaminase [Nitrosospira sp. Nsp18]